MTRRLPAAGKPAARPAATGLDAASTSTPPQPTQRQPSNGAPSARAAARPALVLATPVDAAPRRRPRQGTRHGLVHAPVDPPDTPAPYLVPQHVGDLLRRHGAVTRLVDRRVDDPVHRHGAR